MLMTQGQYAKHRGVSQQAISKAVRASKIPLVEGKIDSDVADAVYRPILESSLPEVPGAVAASVESPGSGEQLDQAAAAAPQQSAIAFVTPPAGSAAGEQAALARARREKLEFELALQRGEWLPAKETEQAWSERIMLVRNRLLLIPNNYADPTMRARVERDVRLALEECANLWAHGVEAVA